MKKIFFLTFRRSFKIFILSGFLLRVCFAADYLPGEIIVKFKDSAKEADKVKVHTRIRSNNRRVVRRNTERINIATDQDVGKVIQNYKNDPMIEYAEPNYILHAMNTVPNDNLYPLQWGLKNSGQTINQTTANNLVSGFTGWYGAPWSATSGAANPGVAGKDIGMEQAWDILTDCRVNKSGSGVVIGVVDSGVNYTHPDLSDNMWNGGVSWPNHGKNFLSSNSGGDLLTTNDPMDQNGHGTSMSGIIAARGNNSKGSTGVCWRANILAAKSLNYNGSGAVSDIAAGIDYAVANGAKVINLSLGFRGANSSTLENSIANAKNNGVLLIAAAGNDQQNNDVSSLWPCNYSKTYDNVVCVAAVDQAGSLGAISAYGATSVQVGAPGVNIVTPLDGLTTTTTPTLGSTDTLTQWKFTNQSGVVITNGWSFWDYMIAGSFPGSGMPSVFSLLLRIGPLDSSLQFSGTTTYPKKSTLRAYNLTGETYSRSSIYDVFKFCYYKKHNLALGDSVSFGYRASSKIGDPFSGTPAPNVVDVISGTNETFVCHSAPTCLDNTCSFGFSATTLSAATTSNGLLIWQMKTTKKTPDSASTTVPTSNLSTGTSDATAFVTGLAAMIYANNGDNFTYLNVKNAILNGGVLQSALAGKTVTGKMINAYNSLKYIEAPQNVTGIISKSY